jgi:hypothetical protein
MGEWGCSGTPTKFVPHPGTGANRWLAAETRTNAQTLRLGGAEPARLTITVLP